MLIYLGGWDGLGSIVKAHARQVIKDNPYNNPIKDPKSFYENAKSHYQGMKIFYVSEQQIQEICAKVKMDERLVAATTIKGTHRLHSFKSIPGDTKHLLVKPVSKLPDSEAKVVRIS